MQGGEGQEGVRPARLTRRDWIVVLLAVAPAIALVVVAIVKTGHGYLGVSDNGMTELRLRDIGSHWPLIGPFSRDGWSHPGPITFYLLDVPFRLTGSRSNGLLVGAALVNGAAIAGMVVIARRWGGAAFAFLVAIGCLVLVTAVGLEFVWDPWNPFITVLPFGLALFATWGVLCGDRWCIPVLAAVGTYCAQTHVGYVPLVGVLVLIATVAFVVDRIRSAGPHPSSRVPLLLTGGVLVLLWLPPVVQQLTTTPGNLQAIVDYFRSSQTVQGFHHGYDVVSAQFAWNADWIVGGPAVNPFSGATAAADTTSFPVWWLALAAAIVVAWRVGHRAARAFALVLVIAIGASVVAVARTIGPLVEYRLRFVWVLGMLTAVFALWMLETVLARQAWWRAQVATVALLVVVTGLSVYNVARAAGTTTPDRLQGEVAATLSRQLVDRLPPGPGAVLFTVRSFEAGPLITGVMLDLERRGIPVALRDMLDDRLRFGAHRMLDHRPVRSEISFVVNDDIERAARRPCTRELAYWGARPRRERTAALRAIERVDEQLRAGTITGRAAIRASQRYAPALPAAAVFEIGAPAPGC